MQHPPSQPSEPLVLPEALSRLLDAAIEQLARGEALAALRSVEAVLRDRPDSGRGHTVRGAVLKALERNAEALEAFGHATKLAPTVDVPLLMRVELLVELGRAEEAVAALDAFIGLVPDSRASHAKRLSLLLELGRRDQIPAASEAALAAFPDEPEFLTWRAAALRAAGLRDEALAVHDVALRRDPRYLPALCDKGWVLFELGRFEAAMAAFDDALEVDGDCLTALCGMGLSENACGLSEAAMAAFDRIVALDPTWPDGQFNRGVVLQANERLEAALDCYEKVLALAPDHAKAHANKGLALLQRGELAAAEEALQRAVALDPDDSDSHSNLLLCKLYQERTDRDELVSAHLAWGQRFARAAERFVDWPNDCDPERQLRIGFISPDFGQHPVGQWILPILEALDRQRFAVYCYSMREKEDETTRRIKSMVSWRKVVGLPDATLAELIRVDLIDILVDLAGHTGHNRLPCMALKPAPVQATCLGYPFTTGLDAIDYIITDAVAVRHGEEDSFVETVVRLPGGRFCFDPPADAPAVAAPPALRTGFVTFGSFNNTAKISDEVIAVWSRLLHRVPGSRLVLKWYSLADTGTATKLRRRFERHGIIADRLELRRASAHRALLAQYADIDIALDPFPFSGAATTFDALWMGVPVVTLPRWQPVSRQTEGILCAIGRREWVARDSDHYCRLSAELAGDLSRLREMRAGQRDLIKRSAMGDKWRAAREWEAALRTMWHNYITARCETSIG